MSDYFDFEQGDTVLVRVRERGTSGKLQAKFVAAVVGFSSSIGPGSEYVVLSTPWDDQAKLHHYEAEFEVLNDRTTLR